LDGEVRHHRGAALKLPDGIVDGEIVALDGHGVPDFAALQSALSEGKTKDLFFFAFDLLFDGCEDLRKRPLAVRKERKGGDILNGRQIATPTGGPWSTKTVERLAA
jgi:bifunctional non-homologous end joining protein LigD